VIIERGGGVAFGNDEAISLVPSADEATQLQRLLGALVCVHVWAKHRLTALTPVKPASKNIFAAFIRSFELPALSHNPEALSIGSPDLSELHENVPYVTR
jgi:hypothetical protein